MGVEVTDLGNDTLRTYIDVFGIATALIGYEVRAYIERELGGIGKSTGEYSVDIHLVALT